MVNILVLCTGNSARSIIAEALLNHIGAGKVSAYSAGSSPTGTPNPFALRVLKDNGLEIAHARSKSWHEFSGDDAPVMDIVITVCANAAGEVCSVWPGHPATAHWGVADPAAISGTETEISAAFLACYCALKARIEAFFDGDFDSQTAYMRARQIERDFGDNARIIA